MQQETFIINNREFTSVRMNPFEANKILLRLQKIALPIIGALTAGKTKSLLDVDVKEAAAVIAQHLDESLMESIVLPMFKDGRVYCSESKVYVSDAAGINKAFTTENLFDMYELIVEVARFQFGPFIATLVSRFGGLIGESKKA